MNRNKYIQEIDKVFKDFIRTDEERVLFERTYQVHELKKGEIFLKKGDPWYKFGFILEGSIYSYYYDDNGEKSIVKFYYFPQNYNVADYETYLNETEVALWYECFEDSALLLFDGRKFNEYYDDIPGIPNTD